MPSFPRAFAHKIGRSRGSISSDDVTPAQTTHHSRATSPNQTRRHSASESFATDTSEKPYGLANPFQTPGHSTNNSSLYLPHYGSTRQPTSFFHSRRVRKENIEKPWLAAGKDRRQKWQTLIPALGLLIGLLAGGYMVYNGWTSVPEHRYCPVLDQDFSVNSNLDPKVWTKEAEVGGFGNGQFEQTTVTDENVFVKDGMLQIKPTLQDEKLITRDSVINLFDQGICSSDVWSNCVSVTNVTNGTIVQPARSGRISTKKGAFITYGRVEVTAKMPAGDWLWPAIWMLPVDNTYGQWPLSGEIDIAESRGNNYSYPLGGNNMISSALHWGPNVANDAWWQTFGKVPALHTTFADKFHTFGLEWSEKYIYMYLNSRLLQVMYNRFDRPLWQRGRFPLADRNGTSFVDPWSATGDNATPFNKNFYLILNVAVGGTNGWFADGATGKPWVDGSPTAKKDFWEARDRWYPTWKAPEMQVKSVRMWQQAGHNGC